MIFGSQEAEYSLVYCLLQPVSIATIVCCSQAKNLYFFDKNLSPPTVLIVSRWFFSIIILSRFLILGIYFET